MQFKPLANTGILVPEICLGTMTFGEQNTQAQAFEQLDYALAQGINFLGHCGNVPCSSKT